MIQKGGLFKKEIALTVAKSAGKISLAELLRSQEINGVIISDELKKDAITQCGKTLAVMHEKVSHGDAHFNNFMIDLNPLLEKTVKSYIDKGFSRTVSTNKAIQSLKKQNISLFSMGVIDIETMQEINQNNPYLPNVGSGKNEVTDLFKALEFFHSDTKKEKFGVSKEQDFSEFETLFWKSYCKSASLTTLSRSLAKLKNEGFLAKKGRSFDHKISEEKQSELRARIDKTFKEELQERSKKSQKSSKRSFAPQKELTGTYRLDEEKAFTPREREAIKEDLLEDHFEVLGQKEDVKHNSLEEDYFEILNPDEDQRNTKSTEKNLFKKSTPSTPARQGIFNRLRGWW